MNSRKKLAVYLRDFTFGVEDSLVSTVGLLSGVAMGGLMGREIIIAGVVLIFVEAFSMGVGNLFSERTANEALMHKDLPLTNTLSNGLVMFFSYFFAGFIPLLPYLFLPVSNAIWVSILLTLAALFTLGAATASKLKGKILRHGLQMLVIGGLAVGIGVLVGIFAQNF